MNFPRFFAQRIAFRHQGSVSGWVVRLAIGTMAVCVAVMEISLSFVQGFDDAIRAKVAGFSSHIHIGNYMSAMDDELHPLRRDAEFVAQLPKAFPQIERVEPYIGKFAMLRANGDMEAIYVKGVDSAFSWRFFQNSLVAGTIPNFQNTPTEGKKTAEILISRTMADHLQLAANDEAALLFFDGEKLKRRTVRIAGIYQTGMEEFDGQILLCDIALLQGVLNWDKAEVSGFEVSCQSFPEIHTLESLAADVSVALPMEYEALPITKIYPEIFDWLGLQHQNVAFILLLMTIVAVINMVSVVLILIIERTRTIGILRAMGLTAWRTQQIFLWNAFYLVLMGVILGNILGLGLLYSQHVFGWLRVDEQTYFIREVPVAWVWSKFALINAGVIAISTVCMLLPTAIISRILPVKAIRWR